MCLYFSSYGADYMCPGPREWLIRDLSSWSTHQACVSSGSCGSWPQSGSIPWWYAHTQCLALGGEREDPFFHGEWWFGALIHFLSNCIILLAVLQFPWNFFFLLFQPSLRVIVLLPTSLDISWWFGKYISALSFCYWQQSTRAGNLVFNESITFAWCQRCACILYPDSLVLYCVPDKSSVAGSEEAEPQSPPLKPRETRQKAIQEAPPKKGRRSRRCGQCSGCQVPEDCGTCTNCLDKPKFGGRNIKKQCCKWVLTVLTYWML